MYDVRRMYEGKMYDVRFMYEGKIKEYENRNYCFGQAGDGGI